MYIYVHIYGVCKKISSFLSDDGQPLYDYIRKSKDC